MCGLGKTEPSRRSCDSLMVRGWVTAGRAMIERSDGSNANVVELPRQVTLSDIVNCDGVVRV